MLPVIRFWRRLRAAQCARPRLVPARPPPTAERVGHCSAAWRASRAQLDHHQLTQIIPAQAASVDKVAAHAPMRSPDSDSQRQTRPSSRQFATAAWPMRILGQRHRPAAGGRAQGPAPHGYWGAGLIGVLC